jgi:hypothetical protein
MNRLQKGTWVKVPKGTKLLNHSGEYEGETSRDVVVEVKDTNWVNWADNGRWLTMMGYAEPDYWAAQRAAYGARNTDAKPFMDKIAAKMGVKSLESFSWSDKTTFVEFLEVVPAPPPKKKSEPKINKKQQMVPKSKWKVTKDLDLAIDIPNTAVESAMAAWDRAHKSTWPNTYTPGGKAAYDAHFKARDAERDRLNATLGEFSSRPIRSLKAGEVFEVMGKWSTYCPYNYSVRGESWVDVQFDGATKTLAIPYKSVEPVIEVESIPTVDVFVIRQKSTGLFYKAYDWGAYHDNGDHKVEYADSFMKAKQYDGVSRAKSSVLELSGYYAGLPGSENLPEWMGHGKVVTFTDDYEFVKFDKLGRKEVETIDLWSWFQRAWELRKLTVAFGSSVRTVYNDLDKRGELDEQKGLLVFKAPDEQDQDWRTVNDKSVFTPEQQKSVDDLVSALNLKRGSFRKAQDFRSFSMSFKDKGAAMIAKLTYGGNLKMHVLDLETLKEVAEG